MAYILPFFSILITIPLGLIVTKRLSIGVSKYSVIFFTTALGIILFTAISYFTSLLFSFPKGVIASQVAILAFEFFYIFRSKISLNLLPYLYSILVEKALLISIIVIGTMLFILFVHHIFLPIDGNLYTGESTYGDLPFHLSTISHIAYGQRFPPDNPMYAGEPLVYPYLINFFSAVLVYEGWSPRLSIIIPGLILSISLIGLIYDFALSLTKNHLKSFISVLFYFFNGGLGFYFFLRDYSFNLSSIIQALSNPGSLKEYSHLFEQNIQWGNFLSRMIIPERSLLFGIPAGIIILRLLFFRDTNKAPSIFDLILTAFLISLMPLLHTHTVLVMVLVLPVIAILTLNLKGWKNQLTNYAFVVSLAVIFAIPHIPLFLNHVNGSEGFFRLHFWWMKGSNESAIWFWFKNTYLLIPLSAIILAFPKMANRQIRILQVSALVLLAIVNLALFSPYNWDNVKFLFWAGLFFDIAAASFLGYFLQRQNWFLRIISVFIVLTMVSSALLSIWREMHVKYALFSKESVEVGEQLKNVTSPNALFLTYKIHNSPVNNLAGRSIMMGYPGLLWTQGINYQNREKDIENIYNGSSNAKLLMEKYGIDYVVTEPYNPEGMYINRNFFNQYPILLKTDNYTVYKVR